MKYKALSLTFALCVVQPVKVDEGENMHLVTAQGEARLFKEVECKWIRPIWYQPGATLQIEGGTILPVTRRVEVFSRMTKVKFVGRIAAECGAQNDPVPSAADLVRRGPQFSISYQFQVGAVNLYLVPGKRTIRIDRIKAFNWKNTLVGATVGNPGINILFISGQITGNSTPASTILPLDPDANLSLSPSAEIGTTLISAQAYSDGVFSGAGSDVMPIYSDTSGLPVPLLDYGDYGPIAYPARQGVPNGCIAIQAIGIAGTDFVQVLVNAHEELF